MGPFRWSDSRLVLQRHSGVSCEADGCPAVLITAWVMLLGGSRRWMRWWS